MPMSRASNVAGAASSHWTWNGGSAVTVGYGETVDSIARKHGVPASAIMQTNGIRDASQIRPGQRLVIPRYVSSATQTRMPRRTPAPRQCPRRSARRNAHEHRAPQRRYADGAGAGKPPPASSKAEYRRSHYHSRRAAIRSLPRIHPQHRSGAASRAAARRCRLTKVASAAPVQSVPTSPRKSRAPPKPRSRPQNQRGHAVVPLAGKRPRHCRLRQQAERHAERRHQSGGAGRHADQGRR